ncbi:MAG: hypothetical protein HYY25_14160 [Candidatus Wallbacteria bacterium]|nr:hypothetical protein [Candidatus Wallbacteria bacterium]
MARHPILTVLAALFLAQAASALEVKIIATSPDAEARSRADGQWRPVARGMILGEGDCLSTGHRASVVLELPGPVYVLVQGLTQLAIEHHHRVNGKLDTRLYLRIGAVRVKMPAHAAPRHRFVVATNAGETSVDAREKRVSYAEEFGMRVESLAGPAHARARGNGRVRIGSGQAARTVAGRAFSPREEYRASRLPDVAVPGSDDSELESAREFNQVHHRPLADQTTSQSISELASVFTADSALAFRFEILTAP